MVRDQHADADVRGKIAHLHRILAGELQQADVRVQGAEHAPLLRRGVAAPEDEARAVRQREEVVPVFKAAHGLEPHELRVAVEQRAARKVPDLVAVAGDEVRMAAEEGSDLHVAEVQLQVRRHGIDAAGRAVEPVRQRLRRQLAAEQPRLEALHKQRQVHDVVPVAVAQGDEVTGLDGGAVQLRARRVGDEGVRDHAQRAETEFKAGDRDPPERKAKVRCSVHKNLLLFSSIIIPQTPPLVNPPGAKVDGTGPKLVQ